MKSTDKETDSDILAEMLIEKLEKNVGQFSKGRIITEYRLRNGYIERYTVDLDKNVSLWTQLCNIGSHTFWHLVCEHQIAGWSHEYRKKHCT